MKLKAIEVSPQELLDCFRAEKAITVPSPYNVLDPTDSFSPTEYGQSVNYLHALNVVRKVDFTPETTQLTVNELRFGVKLKQIKPREAVKYFSLLKGGCNVVGGFEDSTYTQMKILGGQIDVGFLPDHDTLDIEKSKHEGTKPISMDMRDMRIVMESFNRLLKENYTALFSSNSDVNLDIAYYRGEAFPLGKILLRVGGEENLEPQTQLVPVEVH
jgi:hypothetical protein